ncbi:hypothetical protein NEFER03_0171 [Nematocida sp. LUAm3]|nr:hypothetical protein NEFER03_0171 [Nematocida sp. LUAm3]KAI5173624.1 hypothetical protein NEFER02_0140 [Nematocida sp. LUAm2]KAI5176845.1 hypothetical protein NEFER01_0170 [Nematocida sp. LUAm1]
MEGIEMIANSKDFSVSKQILWNLLEHKEAAAAFLLSFFFMLWSVNAYGICGGCPSIIWMVCFSFGNSSFVDLVRTIGVRVSSSIFFFFCSYFLCLFGALCLLLHFSTVCFTLTDNIAISGSSFVLCSFFMLFFYAFTKETVQGGIVSTILAILFFIGIELFMIAFLVIILSEPEIFFASLSRLHEYMQIFISIGKRRSLERKSTPPA